MDETGQEAFRRNETRTCRSLEVGGGGGVVRVTGVFDFFGISVVKQFVGFSRRFQGWSWTRETVPSFRVKAGEIEIRALHFAHSLSHKTNMLHFPPEFASLVSLLTRTTQCRRFGTLARTTVTVFNTAAPRLMNGCSVIGTKSHLMTPTTFNRPRFATTSSDEYQYYRRTSPAPERLPERNPYTVLNVSPKSTPSQIKAAFRELAMTLHPDRHANSDEQKTLKFKEVNEAYEWLADESRRRRVDAQFVNRTAYNPALNRRGFVYVDDNDPTVWRGPQPGWSYSPEAKKWRQRFWILKGFAIFGFLGYGLTVGNLRTINERRREIRRKRQAMLAQRRAEQQAAQQGTTSVEGSTTSSE